MQKIVVVCRRPHLFRARIEQAGEIWGRFSDILTYGKYEVVDEIYAPDFVNHHTTKDVGLSEDQPGSRGWRAGRTRPFIAPT